MNIRLMKHVTFYYQVSRFFLVLLLSQLTIACGGGAAGGVDDPAPAAAEPSSNSPAPTVSISANPAQVSANGSSTLTWSASNATSCTASGAWTGTKAVSGSQGVGPLTTNKTYTLSCTGAGGSASKSTTVTVTAGSPAPTVNLTANPAQVNANGSSTLTWSTSYATSCEASGAWSGSKSMSGSQNVGPLTTTSSFSLACTGAGGSGSTWVTVTVGTVSGGLPMPSLEDERNTYRSWGWTWSASAEAVSEPISGYYITNIDVHGDAEGDDLWTYLMMYRRTGKAVYLNRAQAWLRYFKNEYRTSPEFEYDRGFLLDHLYGWGLVAWYEYTCGTSTCDTAALTEAENIAAEVEAYWNETNSDGSPRYVPGQTYMAQYSLRQGARHLLLATRVAEATNKQRWISLRDKLINLWLQSPDWDARGMYFMGSYYTNEDLSSDPNCKYSGASSCPYEQGARIVPSFHIGILTEAFEHAYRKTGNTQLKDRIVAMARFVNQYGLDATYQYTGKTFGIVNGSSWHSYSATCGTSCSFWDPVYTTSLVNTLVRGYKYTGEGNFYDQAKYYFNRGTKGIYGSPTAREAADNVVGHFVDTQFASSTGFMYLDYNKGELQYTYLMFEAP